MKFSLLAFLCLAGGNTKYGLVSADNYMQGFLTSDYPGGHCTDKEVELIQMAMLKAEVCAGDLMDIHFQEAEKIVSGGVITQEVQETKDTFIVRDGHGRRHLEEIERELQLISCQVSCCPVPMCAAIPLIANCRCGRRLGVPLEEAEETQLKERQEELIQERRAQIALSSNYALELDAVDYWIKCFNQLMPRLEYNLSPKCYVMVEHAMTEMIAVID